MSTQAGEGRSTTRNLQRRRIVRVEGPGRPLACLKDVFVCTAGVFLSSYRRQYDAVQYLRNRSRIACKVDHLGVQLPSLIELRLERGSTLASFRDFGNSMAHLRVLWLSACGVCHLDGVGALVGLEELYLAFNEVQDLTSIALHDRLEVCHTRV